ncbi:MAG TPA: nuclear transport factor 2 family protein [Acidobacteriaceae bacterium]
MRRLSLITALLVSFAWPLAAPAQAATQTILHIEDQWLHAKTAQEAAQFLAPDFVGVSTQGVIETREQRLARFRPAPQPPATAVRFERLTVAFPAPDVAIATGQVVATAGSATPVYIVTFSDTFCLRHGRWLAVHAQETLASSQGRSSAGS